MSPPNAGDIAARLTGQGLELDLGAMRLRIRSRHAALAPAIATVYRHHLEDETGGFVDAQVELQPHRPAWRPWRRELRFLADGAEPFGPAPAAIGLAQLEWGMNWVYANLFSRHLLLHAGALEYKGVGLLLAASPGAGKSTLTAALGLKGFRILSDEFGSLRLADRQLLALAKPVALKNASIALIRSWSADAVFGPTFLNTHKGDVAHLALPRETVRRRREPARPGLILFPSWVQGAGVELTRVMPARALTELVHNSFNYGLLGQRAFAACCDLVASCQAYRLTYGSLEAVVPELARLCEARAAQAVPA